VLDKFENLLLIDASDNKITEVTQSLPNLNSFLLMNNRLKKFPVLNNMQKLIVLNLKSNNIKDLNSVNPKKIPNVQNLDLSDNKIGYEGQ